ncbi:MAG: hypothetical protein GX780_03720 [Campylobacteraceae bacterium]|nr:hypothetical protein [Campylobacteraceae bacterium]
MPKITALKSSYSPFYFLGALGAGGLSASFFMYLNFLIPHPHHAMVTAEILFNYMKNNLFHTPLIAIALFGIVYFAYQHFSLLIWNIREYSGYKPTDAYVNLHKTNGEVALMAIPLTYAMSINVGFVLGATFVPGLWAVIEWLFPMALLGFIAVGFYALRLYGSYFTRLMVSGNFVPKANNNFSQLIAIFSFSMIAVGFAAPGAMSSIPLVSALGIFGAIFFAATAIGLGFLMIVFAMRDIFAHGVQAETSVSLWVMLPILTLLGITAIRITFGLTHNFMGETSSVNWVIFLLSSTIFSLQLIFGWIGYKVMKKLDYFNIYINGKEKSPISFAIICPGVAFFVFGMFFLMLGLVANEIVEIYSSLFFVLISLLMWVQWLTIKTFFTLKKNLLYV